MALTRIQSNGQLIPEVLIVKNGEESKVINSNFNYVSSPCPPGGCQNCVKVRQSRVDDPLLIPELSTMELQTIHCENCSPKSSEFLYFDSKDDLIITAVVNVHESSKNPFKCSSIATLTGMSYEKLFNFKTKNISYFQVSSKSKQCYGPLTSSIITLNYYQVSTLAH